MVATSSVQQTKGFIQPQAPLENRLAGLTLTRLPQTTQSYAQDITTPADSDYLTNTTSAAQSLPRSDSMSTLELEGFKAQVHQDYALFTLLKVFLSLSTNKGKAKGVGVFISFNRIFKFIFIKISFTFFILIK